MTRLNLLLVALLVLCSLALVTSQHQARRLFIDVERAQAQAAQLEVRWNQLQVEQTALATASLIDGKARRDLAMQAISPARTLHLVFDPVDRVARLASPLPDLSPKASAKSQRRPAASPRSQAQQSKPSTRSATPLAQSTRPSTSSSPKPPPRRDNGAH